MISVPKFKFSFSNILLVGITGLLLYQFIFTWIPLWRSATELKGVDISHIQLENEQGEWIAISDFRGEKLIINFWATWCLPCRAEIPMLRGIYSSLKENKKQLIAVNQNESWKTIIRFREKNPMPFPLFKDAGELSRKLNIRLIPAIAVIDQEGKIESITYGFRPWIQAYLLWWV